MRQQYEAVWNMEFCPQRAYKPGRITMLNLRVIQRIMHKNDSWKDQAKRADSRRSSAHMLPTDSIRYQAYIIVRGSIYDVNFDIHRGNRTSHIQPAESARHTHIS